MFAMADALVIFSGAVVVVAAILKMKSGGSISAREAGQVTTELAHLIKDVDTLKVDVKNGFTVVQSEIICIKQHLSI